MGKTLCAGAGGVAGRPGDRGVGCDAALHVIPLAERTGGTPALATAVLRELRMIKDPAEIDALRAAGRRSTGCMRGWGMAHTGPHRT